VVKTIAVATGAPVGKSVVETDGIPEGEPPGIPVGSTQGALWSLCMVLTPVRVVAMLT